MHSQSQLSKIVVATHIEPPLVYQLVDGSFHGSNVEVAKLLAESLNLEVEFVYCPFARCLYQTQTGQADMMVGINYTEQRAQFFSYLAQPYSSLITPVKFYLNKNRPAEINKYEDLVDKKIGVLRGAVYFQPFDNDPRLAKVPVVDHEQLIALLRAGRIDTFLARDLSIRQRINQVEYSELLDVAEFSFTKRQDLFIAISKKSPLSFFQQSLSSTLLQLKQQGNIEKIMAKYCLSSQDQIPHANHQDN
ncbi:substrate-binding periplasmic protein [Catenovulum agarivorans]|uniref:substrate-binding periplasmic protein n=1 Tax=Catenovulum agarivorans TaxID=1172192 RepID=UPI00031554F9|nr:transporter substrate-binding domain-containing protein [Catenovulum agarivorans]